MKKIILLVVFILMSVSSFCDKVTKEETAKEFKIKIINESGDIIKFNISKISPFKKEMVIFSKYTPKSMDSISSVFIQFNSEDKGFFIPVGLFGLETAFSELESDNFSLKWYYTDNPAVDPLLKALKSKSSFVVTIDKYDYDFKLK